MADNMDEIILHPDVPVILNKVRHPGFYVVYGASGIGKKTALLQSLPDPATHLVVPEKTSISLQQMNEATEQFHLRSAGNQEYLVVDDAHTLTLYAQNALLKTLEELPSHVTVVMVTPEPHRLLDTIRSRAFFLHIPPPATRQIQEWMNGSDVDREQQTVLMETVGNRPAALAEYVRDPSLRTSRSEQYGTFQQLCAGTLQERLLAAARLQPHMPDVLDDIIRFSRSRVRQEGEDWTEVVMAAERAQRLLSANCNKKFILDAVAMRATL